MDELMRKVLRKVSRLSMINSQIDRGVLKSIYLKQKGRAWSTVETTTLLLLNKN